MREFFFDAISEHPRIAWPLSKQAEQALWSFRQFLTQAIHTAKTRQSRYELPWKRLQGAVELHLHARDTLLLIPRGPTGWLIRGMGAESQPDLGEPLVIANRRGLNIRVLTCTLRGDALRLETAEPLQPDDIVFWGNRAIAVEPEGPPPAPTTLQTEAGEALHITHQAIPDESRDWRVIVEGRIEDRATLLVDGAAISTRTGDPLDGVLRLSDERGRTYDLTAGVLRTEDPPEGVLRADNGVRFEVARKSGERRQGPWVELLSPETMEGNDFMDPRAAFCEDDAREVWTEPRHRKDVVYKVKRVDRERYHLLLDRYPPAGSSLFLPVDVRSLYLQRRAIQQLVSAPLPHQRGLLRLCEDPAVVRWPPVRPTPPARWFSLVDETRSGTEEQRQFVAKALATSDLAILEGPPGSGKTTAICEIVQQLVSTGQRVLLCASTNVAIDNVIERLLSAEVPVDAVRIGNPDRVDPRVQQCQLDARVDALVEAWRGHPELGRRGDGELRDMAERTVVFGANLTCGTTMGIVNHPFFRDRGADAASRDLPLCSFPHFDVLIVDEASKTLIQEFLVPAVLARRHIVVGDVHQLPPFTDRGDLVANLGSLIDENNRPIFPPEHQRARTLVYRLGRDQLRDRRLRWLIVEPPAVLDCLVRDLLHEDELPDLELVRVVRGSPAGQTIAHEVPIDDLRRGKPAALRLATASWVLVADDLLAEAATYLPPGLLVARDLTRGAKLPEQNAFLFRQRFWVDREGALRPPLHERGRSLETVAELERHERKWLEEHDWAGETAWRLTRAHELRWSKKDQERNKLNRQLEELGPATASVRRSIQDIHDIALPSILEVIQTGIGEERTHKPSTLTAGLGRRNQRALQERFGTLSYQHRMHHDIAEFARRTFYEGKSLTDANTIALRDAKIQWDFALDIVRSRRTWVDVRGVDRGVNREEIDVMRAIVRRFLAWAKKKGPPDRSLPRHWEVACLCFYTKQELAIRDMVSSLLGQRPSTRFEAGGVEIICGTVDRFQGREADLVLLSMRNMNRIGFLDSPNRLNVALTRARQQLFVLGHAPYFTSCRVAELEELASTTAIVRSRQLEGDQQ